MYREVLRIARLFLGLFLYGAGVVLTIHANLGYSPWDVFHAGLGRHTGLSIGAANIVLSVAIVVAFLVMKEHVGFGTLCNMIAVGGVIDLLTRWGRIPVMEGFMSGVVMMFGGLFVIAAGSFFYIGAGYGSGPRDSLMVIMAKRTGKPVGFCRCCVEGTVLFLGWLLGGYAGIGTVLAALGVGLAVQTVFTLLRFDVGKVHQEPLRETWARFIAGCTITRENKRPKT
ncbi:MAG: hypothetical protein LBD04_01775 [Synergistaceae bacterium]|nr:hypothetical protein [Synergistaceae bacterium]